MSDAPRPNKPLSVTDITRRLKTTVARHFDAVFVEGEVASFTPHRSGHWYFSLKDSRATINAIMFRNANLNMAWKPKIGDKVIVKGQIDIYPPQGKYNLVVRRMLRAGMGAHQQKVEALKKKLHAEGAMDPARKRPLPFVPRAIGVATSGSGAAFHDIRKVLERRFPNVTLYLASCRVQGETAAREIAAAIETLNLHGRSDVLIVGRGGGSREDLAAFDEEIVARAILSSRIPVVSAVGHEIDVSVADLVADRRAATPSHAAELVVPERTELLQRISKLDERLLWSVHRDIKRRREALRRTRLRDQRERIAEGRLRVDEISDRLEQAVLRDIFTRRQVVRVAHARLRHPTQRLREARMRCDVLHRQLQQAMAAQLQQHRQALHVAQTGMPDPSRQLTVLRERLQVLEMQLQQAMSRDMTARGQRMGTAVGQLQALSPLAVLSRGYALALRDGQAVRDASALNTGDVLELRLAKGQRQVVVKGE